MIKPRELLSAYSQLITAKEQELLEKQSEVLTFIDTPHSIKGTKKYFKEMRKTEIDLNKTISSLLTVQKSSDEFREEANNLYRQSKELKIYTRDINKALSDDLSEKYRSLIDPIKAVGFIIGLGIACVNIAKNTFDPNLAHGTAETSVGALGGIFITYHHCCPAILAEV